MADQNDDTGSSGSGTSGTPNSGAGDPAALGDAGKEALRREREARAAAERQAADLAARIEELESKDASELERATKRAADAEARAVKAETHALRLEVAVEKGLTPRQAKRLTGATRDELEADADELLEDFGGARSAGGGEGNTGGDGEGGDGGDTGGDGAGGDSRQRRPRENLKPGSGGDGEAVDDAAAIATKVMGGL